jgi:serine/threonine-protein kinase
VASNTPAPPARTARLAFAVSPWGEVYVDGRRRGITPPLQEIKLPPGKHVVEIRNTTFRRHSQTVDLDADASVRIKHKFQ